MSIAHFTARVVSGAGRGNRIGTPTLNLSLEDVPQDLRQGIYAAFAVIGGLKHPAAMHYGPRPVFRDSESCEVHLLDAVPAEPIESLEVEAVTYLREVRDFPSVEQLQAQIAEDIRQTRAILNNR